jgi:hypothetical protein
MTHKIEAFACDYCLKILQSKAAATHHERHRCKYSSLAACCDGCASLMKSEPEIGFTGIGCLKGHSLMDKNDGRPLWRKHCGDWSPLHNRDRSKNK